MSADTLDCSDSTVLEPTARAAVDVATPGVEGARASEAENQMLAFFLRPHTTLHERSLDGM